MSVVLVPAGLLGLLPGEAASRYEETSVLSEITLQAFLS